MLNAPSGQSPVKTLPASGPKLGEAIDQALRHLNDLAIRRDFDPKSWPQHAKLWRELLKQSKEKGRSGRNIAPNLLKGDLAAPIAVNLTGRHWGRFQKWFERSVAPELISISLHSKVPAVKAVRVANPKGGFPDQSEAMFFLAYFDPAEDAEAIFLAAEQCGPRFLNDSQEERLGHQSLSSIEQSSPNASGDAQKCGSIGKSGASVTGKSPESFGSARHATCSDVQQDYRGEDAGKVRKRWQFGLSMVLLGFFLLVLCSYFPDDSRRYMFLAFSVIVFVAGIWDMDRGNKGISR